MPPYWPNRIPLNSTKGELSEETIEIIARDLNNVFQEYRIVMVPRKSA